MKKILSLVIVTVFMFTLVFSALEDTGNVDQIELRETDRDLRECTAQYDPVCGVDGKTYSNSCVAGNIKIEYKGECEGQYVSSSPISEKDDSSENSFNDVSCSSIFDEESCLNQNQCEAEYSLAGSSWYNPMSWFAEPRFSNCSNTNQEDTLNIKSSIFINESDSIVEINDSGDMDMYYSSATWVCGKLQFDVSNYQHTKKELLTYAKVTCDALCSLGSHCEFRDFRAQ